jgi:hypothetical protein
MSYSLLEMQEKLRNISMDGVKSVAAGNHGPAHQILGMDEIKRRELAAKDAEAEAAEAGAQEPPMIDQYMQMAEMIGAPQRMPQGMNFPGNNIQPQAPAQIQQSMQPQNMANMMASQESFMPPAEMRYNEGGSVNPLKTLSEMGSPLLASQQVKEGKMKKAMEFADRFGISVEEAMEILEAQSKASPGPGIGYNEGGPVYKSIWNPALEEFVNYIDGVPVPKVDKKIIANEKKPKYMWDPVSKQWLSNQNKVDDYPHNQNLKKSTGQTNYNEGGSVGALEKAKSLSKRMNIPLGEAIEYLEDLKNNAKLGYGGEYFSGDFDDSRSALKKYTSADEEGSLEAFKNYEDAVRAEAISLGYATPESFPGSSRRQRDDRAALNKPLPIQELMKFIQDRNEREQGLAELGPKTSIDQTMYSFKTGGPIGTHQMPDGTFMPGRTHEEAVQMGIAEEYQSGGGVGIASVRPPLKPSLLNRADRLIMKLLGMKDSDAVGTIFDKKLYQDNSEREQPEMRTTGKDYPYGLGYPKDLSLRSPEDVKSQMFKNYPSSQEPVDGLIDAISRHRDTTGISQFGSNVDYSQALSAQEIGDILSPPSKRTIAMRELEERERAEEEQRKIQEELNKKSQEQDMEKQLEDAMARRDIEVTRPDYSYFDETQAPEKQSRIDRAMSSPWWALMQAGLETAASDSPDAIKNIAGGLSEGFKDYQSRLVQRENLKRAEEQQQSTQSLNEAREELARANAEFYRSGRGKSEFTLDDFLKTIQEGMGFSSMTPEEQLEKIQEATRAYYAMKQSEGSRLAGSNVLSQAQLQREASAG